MTLSCKGSFLAFQDLRNTPTVVTTILQTHHELKSKFSVWNEDPANLHKWFASMAISLDTSPWLSKDLSFHSALIQGSQIYYQDFIFSKKQISTTRMFLWEDSEIQNLDLIQNLSDVFFFLEKSQRTLQKKKQHFNSTYFMSQNKSRTRKFLFWISISNR